MSDILVPFLPLCIRIHLHHLSWFYQHPHYLCFFIHLISIELCVAWIYLTDKRKNVSCVLNEEMSTVKTLWRLAICKEGQCLFSVRKWKTMQCALPYQSTCILYSRHKRRASKYSSVSQTETSFIKLAQLKKNHWYKKIACLKARVSKCTETIIWWFSFYFGPYLTLQSCIPLVIISSSVSYFIYIFICVHQWGRMPALSKHFGFHLQALL